MISKKYKLFVITEAKTVLSRNTANVAKSQLKNIEAFIRQRIPFNDNGWRLVKTIAFSEKEDDLNTCELCADFVWDRQKINIQQWWLNLTQKVTELNNKDEEVMEIEGNEFVFAEILKFLIFYSLKSKNPYLCDRTRATRKNLSANG